MKITVRIRANEIAQMILSEERKNYTQGQLVNTVMEMYGVGKRQAERYVAIAKNEIANLRREEAKDALSVALKDREFLLHKAKGVEDENGNVVTPPNYYLYLEIIKDRDRLLGLYPVKQQKEIFAKNVDMEMFTIYGLERLANGDALEDVMRDKKAVKKG